jgi:hypothetical protein
MTGLRRWISALTPTDFLCIGLAAWGLFAWSTGILHESFDHDEFEHSHVAWLIAHGRRPFYDFFECHPPFAWYPLALLLRLSGDRYGMLFVFRFLTALGHVAFFVALAGNVSLSVNRLQIKRTSAVNLARTFVLGLAVIAGHPAILRYLIEFRLDAWQNALLLFAIYRHRSSARGPLRSSAELGFFATVAIACSPKLLIFGAAFVVFDLLRQDAPSADPRVRRIAGLAVGVTAAVGCLLVFLFAFRLDPRVVFRLSLTYHAQLNQHGGFGHGLARSLWGQRVLLAIVVAAAVACIAQLRARLLSHPFESATIVFLGAQLLFVGIPNKQYYGPWFLMALGLVPYLELAVVRVSPLRSLLVATAILYGAANLFDYQRQSQEPRAAMEISERQELLDLVPPDGAVVVSMERHPLFRADTLYHISSSSAPSGYGTARIMTAMNVQPFSGRFSSEFYSRELEARPPHLIVSKGWFTLEQQLAINAFLARHAGTYRQFEGPLGPTFVRDPAPNVPAPLRLDHRRP